MKMSYSYFAYLVHLWKTAQIFNFGSLEGGLSSVCTPSPQRSPPKPIHLGAPRQLDCLRLRQPSSAFPFSLVAYFQCVKVNVLSRSNAKISPFKYEYEYTQRIHPESLHKVRGLPNV